MEVYEESSPAEQEDSSISKEEFQRAIDKLSEIEKSFDKVVQDQENAKSWMFLKNIDLIMALDAIVYHVKIDKKLCDIKKITSSVKYGFSQLKCTQPGCFKKAVMCHKRSVDIPAELYCKEHSNFVDPLSEDLHDFKAELRRNKSILKSLEKQLVVVQEQMKYFQSESSNKDMITYNKIKTKLDEEYGNLKNILDDMTTKANQIVMEETITDRLPQYEPLSFVKSDSEKCKQSISEVLRLIFEANMKSEIDEKLKTILNWSGGIEQYREESKSELDHSVPEEIYEKEFELCKIPTQTLKKMKELEKRVQTLAEAAIAYQKITDLSNFSLIVSLKDKIHRSFMKDCVDSKLRLPDLREIKIGYLSDEDDDLASFLSYCTPASLQLIDINCNRDSRIGRNSNFYVDAFLEAARSTAKRICFNYIDFRNKDLQTVVRAAHNAERIVFYFCCIHCSPGFDFGADISYKTKTISFKGCGDTFLKDRITTDWKEDSSNFSLIVDAICSSGLKESLEEINIKCNPTLSAKKVKEEFKNKGMPNISVVE